MSTRLRGNDPGPVSQIVAENVAIFRRAAGLTQAQLAAKLADGGRPIPVASIAKIEANTRRIDVDDLVALAGSLGTTAEGLLATTENAGPGYDTDEVEALQRDMVAVMQRIKRVLEDTNYEVGDDA